MDKTRKLSPAGVLLAGAALSAAAQANQSEIAAGVEEVVVSRLLKNPS